jgi:hypothetical protein
MKCTTYSKALSDFPPPLLMVSCPRTVQIARAQSRYFFGGRLSSFAADLSNIADGRLYEWHRFGHFHYIVPVATGGKYTLRLYFTEHWFGVQNGGIGGVGSRVFVVYCNGLTLLKGFDIFREAGSKPLVKSFQHIERRPRAKSRST